VRQLGVQILGVAIAAIYAFVVTYGILKLIDRFTPVRVAPEVEDGGLDRELHGEAAYDEPVLAAPVTAPSKSERK
jgi:Amt family ammonium transporter